MPAKYPFADHLKAYVEGRKEILLSRMFVRFTFLSNLCYLVVYLALDSGTNFDKKGAITFYSIRVVFIILATFINWIRYAPHFYIPTLREMSEDMYWSYVLLALFLLRIPFARAFFITIDNPLSGWVHLVLSVILIWILLTSFQSQHWTRNERLLKRKRIRELRHKAKISKTELEKIEPLLIAIARQKEQQPISWRIVKFLFGLLFAVTNNDAAVELVDILSTKIHLFRNVLPPY